MSVSGVNNRITGLASGMDIDGMVEKLMRAERKPLDRLYQQKQLAEWKQEQYRETINALRVFNDKYFNSLNTGSNMLSKSSYIKYSTVSSDSSIVTASSNADAAAGTHKIKVEQLAKEAVLQSSQGITQNICGTQSADFSAAKDKSFTINVDGVKKTIKIDESITDVTKLQEAVDKAVGSGKVTVSAANGDGTGALTFSPKDGSGVQKITLERGTEDALSSLGFGSGANLSNRLNKNETLETMASKMKTPLTFDSEGKLKLTVNGKSFEFDKSSTLSSVMDKINNDADAGVTMKYDDMNDKIIITAKETGAAGSVDLSESGGNLLTAASLTDFTEGKDAKVVLDGQNITRSSNSFTVSGVTYKLVNTSEEEQTVTVTKDTDAVYNNLINFVKDYNDLVDKLNGKLSEEYDRDYPPLTEEEKEAMSEDEIELWEGKAQKGLLKNDPIIEKLVGDMRGALYESVQGVSANLSKIGITTGSYKEKGKLVVDESKLKEAIDNNPDEVMNLFSKQSTSHPGTTNVRGLSAEERQTRRKEEGLAYRLNDIVQDAISTTRNSGGKKGTLLEKAGIASDNSDSSNLLSKEIGDYEKRIDSLLDRLDEKEEAYYKKFTAMESALSLMNSQSDWLSQQFG